MELLEEIEHRAVLLIQQPGRHANGAIRRYAYEVLIERAVMNRAQTETVRDRGCPLSQGVTRDMRRVEERDLSQPADRAAISVRRKHNRPKPALMQAYSDFARGIAPGHLVQDRCRLALVDRADHRAWRDHHHSCGRIT